MQLATRFGDIPAGAEHRGQASTKVRFELAERGPQACELGFQHTGISLELVAAAWDHFLASLAAYAEHAQGSRALCAPEPGGRGWLVTSWA